MNLQCAKCDAVMPHTVSKPNHIAHGLLTLFTAGLYLPIWIIVAIGGNGDATCSKCGNRRETSGAATIASEPKNLSARGWIILLAITVVGAAMLFLAGEYLDI